MPKAWMRILQVRLTSTSLKKSMVFGTNWMNGRDDLNIEVSGSKSLSPLKDACTIKISNLTYGEIVSIISGKFYDVEVLCGYRSGSLVSMFKGGVIYISKSMTDIKTGVVTILCASRLIAKYGQSRLNLTLNSGINMYAALNYICKQAGIPNTNISTQFKTKFIDEVTTINTDLATWIDNLTNSNEGWFCNSDGSTNSVISLFDANKSNLRTIKLNKDNIILTGGYPQLTNDGVRLTVMPTFAFMCGDTIEIDNSIIQIPVDDISEISANYAHFLDKTGEEGYGRYMIYSMSFNLQNRGSDFSISILAKTRSLISNYIGG